MKCYDLDAGKANIVVNVDAANDKVKVSSNDTEAQFLSDKLVAGLGISLTELNDGGVETFQISALSFAVDLDSAEASVTRVFAGGRTTFTVTHNLNTLDVKPQVYRLSDGRTIGWRVERTGVNTVDVSRNGNIANGLFRAVI